MREPVTHPLNVSYLVLGLVFLGISGSWALTAADVLDTRDVTWLMPLVLVVAGVIGLVAVAARGASRRRQLGSGTDVREAPDVIDTDALSGGGDLSGGDDLPEDRTSRLDLLDPSDPTEGERR